jgi:hypothetical protein
MGNRGTRGRGTENRCRRRPLSPPRGRWPLPLPVSSSIPVKSDRATRDAEELVGGCSCRSRSGPVRTWRRCMRYWFAAGPASLILTGAPPAGAVPTSINSQHHGLAVPASPPCRSAHPGHKSEWHGIVTLKCCSQLGMISGSTHDWPYLDRTFVVSIMFNFCDQTKITWKHCFAHCRVRFEALFSTYAVTLYGDITVVDVMIRLHCFLEVFCLMLIQDILTITD